MSDTTRALLAKLNEHSIYIDAVFVPFSKSRNAKTPTCSKCKRPATRCAEGKPESKCCNARIEPVRVSDRSLNWRVTLKRGDRIVYETDYSAGIAHCPSHSDAKLGRGLTVDKASAIEFETEHGTRAFVGSGGTVYPSSSVKRVALVPETADVVASLLLDAEAIDYATYDDYAREWDMDVDSRKGEEMYRACLACGLALRAAFGDALLSELRELAREL